MSNIKYITRIDKVKELNPEEKNSLQAIVEQYAFRTNSYYNSLINWDDPDDPIRRISIPTEEEQIDWGRLDASNEHNYTMAPGLEHKYNDTALLLVVDVCAVYCRFCFRKRLFMEYNHEVVRDVSQGIEYIKEHPEINNVLLTGGDPLIMSTKKLENIIKQLRDIEHVKIIRIGSKIPAFNPFRIIDDPSLPKMLSKYSTDHKKIYIMTHFNHPTEITDTAIKGLGILRKSGVLLVNQTPMIKGVNDDPEVLAELFDKLSYIGVPPYYVFQGRPVAGNKTFAVPLEKGLEIFEQARVKGSGLAKRARFAMSHATGKVEIMGLTEENIYFKYQRAANEENQGRIMVFKRNPDAYWLDDYDELVEEFSFMAPVNMYEVD